MEPDTAPVRLDRAGRARARAILAAGDQQTWRAVGNARSAGLAAGPAGLKAVPLGGRIPRPLADQVAFCHNALPAALDRIDRLERLVNWFSGAAAEMPDRATMLLLNELVEDESPTGLPPADEPAAR